MFLTNIHIKGETSMKKETVINEQTPAENSKASQKQDSTSDVQKSDASMKESNDTENSRQQTEEVVDKYKDVKFSELSVHQKLAYARVMLQEKIGKKSGVNGENNFSFFQLEDFLPSINEISLRIGILSLVQFEEKRAVLSILNTDNPSDSTVEFTIELKEITINGSNAMQALGAVTTYARRYLYQMAFEICEKDVFDKISGLYDYKTGEIIRPKNDKANKNFNNQNPQQPAMITSSQLKLLNDLVQSLQSNEISKKIFLALMKKMKIHNNNDFKYLKREEASIVITKLQEIRESMKNIINSGSSANTNAYASKMMPQQQTVQRENPVSAQQKVSEAERDDDWNLNLSDQSAVQKTARDTAPEPLDQFDGFDLDAFDM